MTGRPVNVPLAALATSESSKPVYVSKPGWHTPTVAFDPLALDCSSRDGHSLRKRLILPRLAETGENLAERLRRIEHYVVAGIELEYIPSALALGPGMSLI